MYVEDEWHAENETFKMGCHIFVSTKFTSYPSPLSLPQLVFMQHNECTLSTEGTSLVKLGPGNAGRSLQSIAVWFN